MPDDDVEAGDLDLECHEDDEISTYDLPGRDPGLQNEDDLEPVPSQVPATEGGAAIDSRGVAVPRTGGSDDAEDAETRHGSTADGEPGTGERVRTGSSASSPHRSVVIGDIAPALPVFTLTLTFRMKNGLGLCCEPRVQALVGQRNSLGGVLPPAVPPLARVLTLAAREDVENADFSLLGAQVSDLLAAYAPRREAAAQAEAQKKKALAAAARQRKRDEEARRMLASGRSTTEGGATGASAAGMAKDNVAASGGTPTAVGARPRVGSQLAQPEPPAADTTQLSLFG